MLKNLLLPVFSGLTLLSVSACATKPSVPIAETEVSPLIPEEDLTGKLVGRGEFSAINGTNRKFTAYLDGSWDGEVLTLVEDFEYDDGQKDQKTWRLTKTGPGEYSGTREDVIDTARGYLDGPAFRLEYKVRLASEDGGNGMTVSFKDILVKDASGDIRNTATVGKWGVRVGKVDLTIEPAEEAGTSQN
ncbi:MAG: hypothetical protein CMK07_00780 [Ponticaulis sp.]|nr:hypothetical protein [Ponticaulis sp.]